MFTIPQTGKALKFAKSHGFPAWPTRVSPGQFTISVVIPWIRPSTGETGSETLVAGSFTELKTNLGY